MADDDLLRQLERTRDGYAAACVWERFLLDSYSSEGGFRGRVRPPQFSFWGPSASLYGSPSYPRDGGDETIESYLDQFPVEDAKKFRRRQDVAHHLNYVAPLTQLKLSHIERKEFAESLPEPIQKWRNDLDGEGGTIDELRPLVELRAATVGWCPVLLDQDPAPVGEDGEPVRLSQLQAEAAGLRPLRVLPLWPANLLDWSATDDGTWIWVKARTDRVEQTTWDAEPTRVSEYRVWTAKDVTTYVVRETRGTKTVASATTSPHPFGRVPIAVFRAQPRPSDPITGLPWHADAATENRRLFNLLSELDEHLRSCVFGMLQAPVKDDEHLRLIQAGNGAVLPVDPDSSRDFLWVTPPTAVAETYERRIEATIREIYRIARVELARASAQAVSGVARAYEFETTNAALRDFARQIALGLEWLYSIAAPALNVERAAALTIKVTPPPKFDLDDLAADIQNALDALTAKLGQHASGLLRKRLARQLLPNLAQVDLDLIDGEIDKVGDDEANAAAMAGLLADAADPSQDPAADPDASDDDGPGTNPSPPKPKPSKAPA